MAGRIRIHDEKKGGWQTPRDIAPTEALETVKDEELDAQVRVHEGGTDETLQLLELRVPPNFMNEVHRHDEDEIIYVVAGEMIVGSRVLKPGSSVFVSGGTFYSFGSGPEGLHILNFRPRKDLTYYVPDKPPVRPKLSAPAE